MPLDPDAAAILSAIAEVETHPVEPQEPRTRAAANAALTPEPDVTMASVLKRGVRRCCSLVVTPEGSDVPRADLVPLGRMSALHAPAEAFHNAGTAHVVIADYDPLSDEGEAYARRLHEAGVPVIMSLYEGQMHGSFIMGAVIPTRAVVLQEAIGHTQRALGSPNMPSGAGAGLVVA